MALLQFPRRLRKNLIASCKSSPRLNDELMHSIARLVAKEMELAEIGQPWHLTVVENLVDRMLIRLRKRQEAEQDKPRPRRRGLFTALVGALVLGGWAMTHRGEVEPKLIARSAVEKGDRTTHERRT